MKKFVLIIFANLLFYSIILSQGEIDDENKIIYRDEKTFGVDISTNGYGGSYRYAKRNRYKARKKTIYEIGLSYLRHPKEIKISTNYYNINKYVHGKLNLAYELNGNFGMQKEFFRKRDKGSVSIRYYYGIGPSLIFLKPIYYEVMDTVGTKHEKFNTSNYQAILGKSSFFLGFDDISINAGAYLKTGFSFEFSKKDRKFTAIEIGASVRGYIKDVEIMATFNTQFLYSLYFTYRFGKVVHGGIHKRLDKKE